MNNFSKDELELIKVAVGWHTLRQHSQHYGNKETIKKLDSIKIKIQFMLDNHDHLCGSKVKVRGEERDLKEFDCE